MKRGTKIIINASLETFSNEYSHRDYVISMICPEFTAVCPISGFPDFGTIYIKYIPDKKCVELKSLKLYINSYRDKGIFHEHLVNKILEDLIKACNPRWLKVTGDYNVRGNVKTIVSTEHLKKGFKKPSNLLKESAEHLFLDFANGKIR